MSGICLDGTKPNEGSSDPNNFYKLTIEEQNNLRIWVARNFDPIKKYNMRHSSYGLKHIYEYDTKKYVDNGTFKGAMLAEGYEPHDPEARNWRFKISERSRAFTLGTMG